MSETIAKVVQEFQHGKRMALSRLLTWAADPETSAADRTALAAAESQRPKPLVAAFTGSGVFLFAFFVPALIRDELGQAVELASSELLEHFGLCFDLRERRRHACLGVSASDVEVDRERDGEDAENYRDGAPNEAPRFSCSHCTPFQILELGRGPYPG